MNILEKLSNKIEYQQSVIDSLKGDLKSDAAGRLILAKLIKEKESFEKERDREIKKYTNK